MSLGSFAGGLINDAAGPRAAFVVVACASVVPMLLVLIGFRAFKEADLQPSARPITP
jgi:predicted MFS family arabinose efflux permease